MNWLDIILIVINVIILLFGIISIPLAIKDEWGDWIIICISTWVSYLLIGWLLWLPFVVLDKNSGLTIGTITSVDKNFFGTVALYIKTNENTQEEYCIEFDEELEEKAKKLIGREVKVSYGERVGLYSTGKCSQAPIESIELVK